MKVTLNWLQTYFDEKLPEVEKVTELLNFRAFEVEGIESSGDDKILDVKILADRACYALCHRGVAGEIGAAVGMKHIIRNIEHIREEIKGIPEIDIKKPALCARYIGRRVESVKVGKSPNWLRERLEAIGERSINNIVDVANFVMFDIGQPLHAFDANKVKGTIQIRLAKRGEKITTLDNQEINLDSQTLIIADTDGPLAIAGIKGGKRAEVGPETKNLILEAANFDKSSIRLTSTRFELKTSAARRFEAGLSPELALEAIRMLSAKIKEVSSEAVFGPVNDVYKRKSKQTKIEVSSAFISATLGVKLTEEEIIAILSKLNIGAEKKGKVLAVIPPAIRTDLNIPEDIVEEVGRIYGYEKITPKIPPPIRGQAMVDKNFYYIEKVKNILLEQGFNEVSLYTLAPKGFFEVAKPLADDKKFLRENLAEGLSSCLERNAKNAPLWGLSEVRVFEIGNVFAKSGERIHLCIGRQTLVKKDRRNEEILDEIISLLSTAFERPLSAKISTSPSGAMAELDITDLFLHANYPGAYSDLNFGKASTNKFVPFSQYPFALRDIAVFTLKGTEQKEPMDIIKKEAGSWLVHADLFDVFEKTMSDGSSKMSYAFHLVFQSAEKTLTDPEVNEVMNRITKEMNSKSGWQVR
jgi:phenylalanyl-tRNA synthetase beta chain